MGYLRREKAVAFIVFNPAKIKKWTTDKKILRMFSVTILHLNCYCRYALYSNITVSKPKTNVL